MAKISKEVAGKFATSLGLATLLAHLSTMESTVDALNDLRETVELDEDLTASLDELSSKLESLGDQVEGKLTAALQGLEPGEDAEEIEAEEELELEAKD